VSVTEPFVLPMGDDPETAAFFAATDAGTFPLWRCTACGTVNGPNERSCRQCRGIAGVEVAAAGGGRVVSYVIQHAKPDSAGNTHRLVVAIVELDEGPWWWTQLAGVEPAEVRVGDRVRLEMVRPEGGHAIPVARPA
jgi:uncharacterized OB-fold protein